ncbi:MAG TPA: class I SAM-dependent methyltransferase [Deltaproteobacteria bacterium]|nr:class I SAM-dependent methyltransferase [Deltaproteobacteria bacterium]HPR54131.1 class I SAM-dependent methyltransferase [Deltaproteobacteria bacterium]HXK47079.1 class I SAM-dependent methyltransferase [Deltaproteobacteria bacterium]
MKPKQPLSDDYELIDSGDGRKLERFGRYRLVRPCAQAIWPPQVDRAVWEDIDASFERRPGKGWQVHADMPDAWRIIIDGLRFRLARTDFGHLGIFPEQRGLWRWVGREITRANEAGLPQVSVLNLFAYSGGATLAAARCGAQVCHLDASKGMVSWARQNAELNNLTDAPVRWIVDDANKFLDREIRRSRRYEAVILDPPTYGHGRNEEVYKIEDELVATVRKCWALLSDRPLFLLLTSHTPTCTPTALMNILSSTIPSRQASWYETGEMLLEGRSGVLPIPSGTYCKWAPAGHSAADT